MSRVPTRGRGTRASAWRRSGLDEVTWSRMLLPVLIGAAVFFAMRAFTIEPRLEVGGGSGGFDRAMQRELRELGTAWGAEQRGAVLARAPQRAKRFAGSLQRLLRQSRATMHRAAIEYAGASGLVGLRDDLEPLALGGPPERRALAIRAAERLAPWSDDVLIDLLSGGHPDVVLAGLEIVQVRAGHLAGHVVPLLAHEDARVAREAMVVVRASPTDAVHRALWGLVDGERVADRVAGLRGLAVSGRVARDERRILTAVLGMEPEAQIAALDCLAELETPLSDTTQLWAWILDPQIDMALRVAAMSCLERTGSYDAEELRRRQPLLEPVLQFCAARCLLREDDAEAVTILLDLAACDDEVARIASRRLLSALTGCGPSADLDRHRTVIEARPELLSRPLPPMPPLVGVGGEMLPAAPSR